MYGKNQLNIYRINSYNNNFKMNLFICIIQLDKFIMIKNKIIKLHHIGILQ